MKFANVGRSDLRVSKIALGTMTFGSGDGFAGLRPLVDAELAPRLVSMAVERGVTTFDSAGRYQDGEAETILGQAIAPYRDRVVISTKDPVLPPDEGGPVGSQIGANVEASLRRLGVDAIDLYQVGIAQLEQGLDGIAESLDAVVQRGLVRHVGVTNLTAWQLERIAATAETAGTAPVVAAQMSYSLLERDIEDDFAGLLFDRGIGVFAWSPLAGGYLTGKYTAADPGGGGGRLSSFRMQPIDIPAAMEVVEVVRSVADNRGVAPSVISLAWVMRHDFVSSALVGVTTTESLSTNLDAADVELSPEEIAALDDVSLPTPRYPHWLYRRASP
jgi:aryl-alcohol dehydrogenase-like predicted oxidoreductase